MSLLRLRIAFSAAVLLASASASANELFHFNAGVGTAVFDITPDGKTAVGIADGSVYRWTASAGAIAISGSDWANTFTAGVSADGNTVVSTMLNPLTQNQEAAKWTEASGWTFLGGITGGIDNHLSSAYDISADGSKIVGLAWHEDYRAEAFSYTSGGGMTGLGRPLTASSRASAISGDGSTVVGFYENDSTGERRPARWTNGGAAELFLGENAVGESLGANTDGSMIVGNSFDFATNMSVAFVHANGSTRLLGVLSEHMNNFLPQSLANAVSDNGIVVGYSGGDPFWGDREEGFVWTEDAGMVSVSSYLTNHGVFVPQNLLLRSVTSISADGTTLGGQAFNADLNLYESWIATVPEPSTLTLVGLAVLSLVRRRRSR